MPARRGNGRGRSHLEEAQGRVHRIPRNRDLLIGAAAAGTLAGMRSTAAPSVIAAWSLSAGLPPRARRAERLLARPAIAAALGAAVLGEVIADKLPGMPPRVAPPALLGRSISGACAGWLIAHRYQRSAAPATMIGGASAVLSTMASYRLRRRALRADIASSPVLGLLEDGVVAAGAVLLWRYLVKRSTV